MAKGVNIAAQSEKLISDAKAGKFAPVYLLMGEEPYYPDLVCNALIENALTEDERDFNQTIYYGLDTNAQTVATEARSYPMMAERRLVVLKEAQSMRSLEELAVYFEDPMETTVLVILMRGAVADKRKKFYKLASQVGEVLESPQLRDYEMEGWITNFYSSRGLNIEPDAAALMAEFAGTDMTKIALETDKLVKNLPEGTRNVTASDIEKNVGISRQFSVFELTKTLSYRNAKDSLRIAAWLGSSPKFAMPMAVSALYMHFNRILKLEAQLAKSPSMSNEAKASLLGVRPFFMKEYDAAVRNYPLPKCMRIMALLEEYDYKGKGGDAGEATPEQLLMELVSKILM